MVMVTFAGTPFSMMVSSTSSSGAASKAGSSIVIWGASSPPTGPSTVISYSWSTSASTSAGPASRAPAGKVTAPEGRTPVGVAPAGRPAIAPPLAVAVGSEQDTFPLGKDHSPNDDGLLSVGPRVTISGHSSARISRRIGVEVIVTGDAHPVAIKTAISAQHTTIFRFIQDSKAAEDDRRQRVSSTPLPHPGDFVTVLWQWSVMVHTGELSP
jgi:hypothetical protein